MKSRIGFMVIIIIFSMLGFQCAELQQLAQIQKPSVNVASVRMTGVSLEEISLAFDLDIHNPNALSVNLAGLDYDLNLNKVSFLQGQQNEDLIIQANSKSRVEIPLTLNFKDLYQTLQALKKKDSTDYTLACGFTFQLPILGPTRIPVSKSGHFPLVKLPKIQVHALKLKKLNFTGADLALELKMDNPNAFKLLLKNLNYDFNVNGLSWAKGNLSSPASVNAKGNNTIRIPMSLNFLEMGKTVYQLVSGSQNLNYKFSGDLGLDTSLPMLKNIDLPIDQEGSLNIKK